MSDGVNDAGDFVPFFFYVLRRGRGVICIVLGGDLMELVGEGWWADMYLVAG